MYSRRLQSSSQWSLLLRTSFATWSCPHPGSFSSAALACGWSLCGMLVRFESLCLYTFTPNLLVLFVIGPNYQDMTFILCVLWLSNEGQSYWGGVATLCGNAYLILPKEDNESLMLGCRLLWGVASLLFSSVLQNRWLEHLLKDLRCHSDRHDRYRDDSYGKIL